MPPARARIRRLPLPGFLRTVWERRKLAVFPRGAITCHLEVWTVGGLAAETSLEMDRLRARFELEDLLVVHGSAMLSSHGVTVVCGPPGAGKSTLLRQLQQQGRASVLEDGLVLLGRRDDDAFLIDTHTFDVFDRASRISKLLRRAARLRFNAWQLDEVEKRRTGSWRLALLYQMPRLCFSLAVLLGPRRRDAVTPRLLPVTTVVELAHPADEFHSVLLPVRGAAVAVAELSAVVPPGVAYRRLDAHGTVVELREQLCRALGLVESAAAS